jgi:B12-binding domain/radical SAM domain protein of rhizo-twelve system
MKYALINPPWSFTGSIYFGCQQQHLPLEFGYSRQVLEAAGHHVRLIDAQLEELSNQEIGQQLAEFAPDITVVTTAPSYLFWRCAPPELRVPMETVRSIRPWAGALVVVGPHASTTPNATLNKLGADAVVLGECEEILPRFADSERRYWDRIPSICYEEEGDIRTAGGSPHASDMKALPPLMWERRLIAKHRHHHHRFEAQPAAPGAEMEVSRGCPYHCTFCAKDNFRDDYRKRHPTTILEELDGLLELGVEYVYFIDEIFLPDRHLLCAFSERRFKFGIQTRVDLWKPAMLELLGQAGCVSLEAGVESISAQGRDRLAKNCRMSLDELTERLVYAKRGVPFVQANLLESQDDDPSAVEAWRRELQKHGIWANKPVPLFPYPGSPEYTRKWNLPDDVAWERAVDYYLDAYSEFSDIQDSKPRRIQQLEAINDR